MITILANMVCRPGTEQEFLAASVAFVAATRAEPGCLDFHLHQRMDDPTRFAWYENFADQLAVDAHVASSHVANWFELVKRLQADNDYALYTMVSVIPPRHQEGVVGPPA
jgi:quinol monooxygenase YgiN